jgi:hypothetical protein
MGCHPGLKNRDETTGLACAKPPHQEAVFITKH